MTCIAFIIMIFLKGGVDFLGGRRGYAPINSKLLHPQADWIVQIPAPSGQNSVQMPYPVVGFVCLSPTFEDLFCKLITHKC